MTNISPEAISELERVIDQKIQNAMIPRQSSYDATVVDVEGDTIWVDIPGVSKLLPAEKSYVSPNPGDLVSVTFHKENGLAVVDGNISNPGIGVYSTIDGSNLLKGSVGNAAFKLGSIAGSVLEDGTITGMKIADSTITNANIADSTITGGKIIGSTLKDIPYASIVDADIEVARIADARIKVAVIDMAQIRDLEAEFANIQVLIAGKASIADLTAANARIDNLAANYASIDYLEANYIDAGTIDAEYIRTDMMNANVGWIQNGTIANAAITNEMVHSVSANKLTAGTIDASKINVANLRAENLIVSKINGQPALGGYSLIDKASSGYSSSNPSALGWYELTNGSFVLSTDTQVSDSKVYYAKGTATKLYDQDYIDGLEDGLNQRIDGAVETFTGSAIPTMSNYPVSGWTASQYASHVGDIYYVVDPTSSSNGYCYRFAYDNTSATYGWVLIKDSDVTKALSDISELKTFESETVSWIDETDEGLKTIRQNHTALSGRVDKTVVETVQLWFTKADTTAPSKPSAHVTTNSESTPNAWNIAVPTYNASYPNYYYCYEWKYADGTYGWSNVTRDIAMGESQQLSRTGVATANGNIKSNVQLWFTKADTTAPAKPSSVVTMNNASTPNAWNIAVPTYNSSYKNYFYCYQQQKGDGTYQWTDVVFDSATTEMMAKSQAALPATTFTTFQQTTFKELVDEVDEQSSTITQMSEQIDKAQTVRTQEGSLGNRTIVTDDAADLPLLTLDPVYGESVQDGMPTPDAPVYIQAVRGRNLIDWVGWRQNITSSSFSAATYTEDGVFTGTSASDGRAWSYANCEIKTTLQPGTYRISINVLTARTGTDIWSGIAIRAAETNLAANTNNLFGTVGLKTLGFTLNETTNVGIMIKMTTGAVATFQLEIGSTVHDYIPYNHLALVSSTGSTTYLDMTDPSTGEPVELHGLNDTYRDILRIDASGHAVVEKRTTEFIWDGKTDATKVDSKNSSPSGYTSCYKTYSSSRPILKNQNIALADKCLSYRWTDSGVSIADNIIWFADSSYGVRRATNLLSEDSVSGMNAYLQENPVKVIAALDQSAWHTIDLGYVNLPTVTDDATVYVAAEIQPVIGGSWWTKAGYETGKTISTTVNSVKQTADSNSSYISNLTSRLGTNADGTGTTTDIVSKYNQIDQDLDGLTVRVGKTEAKTSLRYTFVRDNWTEAYWANRIIGEAFSLTPSNYSSTGAVTATGFDSTSVIVGDLLMVQGTSTDSNNKNWHSLTCKVTSVPSSSSADIPVIIVAVNDTTALASRVTQAETSISQNATAITLRATKTEVASAIDGIEIGGRNLLTGTSKTTEITKSVTNGQSSFTEGVIFTVARKSGETDYVLSFDAKGSVTGMMATCYWYNPNTTIKTINSEGLSGTSSDGASTLTLSTEWTRYWVHWTQSDTAGTDKRLLVGRLLSSNPTGTAYYRAIQLEIGTKATDWTPAPEDMATSAELQIANDAISTKVEKNGVISSINQSSESITINADRVNIEGASLFSSSGALAPSKVVVGTQQQWYSSTSRTALSGGSWATAQPSLTEGHYLWQRTLVTYASGSTSYLPSSNGICISEKSDISVGGRNLVTKDSRLGFSTDYEFSYGRGGELCNTNIIFEDRTLIAARSGNTSIPYGAENTEGAKVTISFEYKLGTNGTSRAIIVYPYQATGLSVRNNLPSIVPTLEWQRYSATTNVYRWTTGNGSSQHGSSYTPASSSDSGYRTNGCIWVYDSAGTNSFVIRNLKIERGNTATDWSPAPEDLAEAATAIGETSRIYYRTNVSNFGTPPSAWVTSTSTANNTWTRKRMPYDSTYNLIYTCEQRKSVSGAFLGCTEVLLDDTTTVIDGGHITTGTIDANRIAATSLSLGKLDTSAQNTISNAAKTATNYITADTDGIKIHRSGDTTTYQHLLATGTAYYISSTKVAEMRINNGGTYQKGFYLYAGDPGANKTAYLKGNNSIYSVNGHQYSVADMTIEASSDSGNYISYYKAIADGISPETQIYSGMPGRDTTNTGSPQGASIFTYGHTEPSVRLEASKSPTSSTTIKSMLVIGHNYTRITVNDETSIYSGAIFQDSTAMLIAGPSESSYNILGIKSDGRLYYGTGNYSGSTTRWASTYVGQQFYAEARTNITTANVDSYSDGASLTLYTGTYVVWGSWAFNTGSTTAQRNTQLRIMVGSTEAAAQRILAPGTNWSKQSVCTVLQISGTSAVVKLQGSSNPIPQAVSTGNTNWIRAVYIGPPNA